MFWKKNNGELDEFIIMKCHVQWSGKYRVKYYIEFFRDCPLEILNTLLQWKRASHLLSCYVDGPLSFYSPFPLYNDDFNNAVHNNVRTFIALDRWYVWYNQKATKVGVCIRAQYLPMPYPPPRSSSVIGRRRRRGRDKVSVEDLEDID